MARRLLLLAAPCLMPVTGRGLAEKVERLQRGQPERGHAELSERYRAGPGTPVTPEFSPSGDSQAHQKG